MINTDVAIIGAGIIGSSCALYLQEAGLNVCLIERQDIASGASYGNAGALAFSEILPLASPKIMHKTFNWLSDPLGPLSLSPAYLPTIAPWLLRFWLASRPNNYRKNIQAQYDLMQLAANEMMAMLDKHKLNQHLVSDGVLEIYDNAQSFALGQETAKTRAEYGIQSQIIQADEISQYQAGISDKFKHAMYLPFWHNISDPNKLTNDIANLALSLGATFIRRQANYLTSNANGVLIQLNDASQIQARHTIICAGAWSRELSKQMGDNIPLETERGYNTTLASDAFDLKRQVTFVDHGFVVSPLSCGIRVGGSVELAGLKRAPNLQRAKNMLDKASKFLPGLKTENGKPWMGFRPSTPDSLPVIGRARTNSNCIYAFGHGHLGLTQAAATARLVSQLVLDQTPSINLQAYRPSRFTFF